MDELRYPIGLFTPEIPIGQARIDAWIADIESLPERLRTAVADLTGPQLDTPYRDGGWTIRQVVHHLADSHMNSYTRFKLALTEDEPSIKPYFEARWAELIDGRTAPVESSLALLSGLHARWVLLLRSLDREQLGRRFYHPESERHIPLDWNVGQYAWHGDHHLAHITGLRDRMGW